MRAVALFPAATFVGKTDDDSFNHFPNLHGLLLRSRMHKFFYGGWSQYASFFPKRFQTCGWSGTTRGAIAAANSNGSNCHMCINHEFCYRRGRPSLEPLKLEVRGPFPFVTGCLELMSAALVSVAFGSEWTREFVSRARMAVSKDRFAGFTGFKWTCKHEDAIVGYAIFEVSYRLNLSVSFTSIGSLVKDVQGAFAACMHT